MCEQSQQSGRSHTPGLLAALARWAVRRNRLVLAAAALLVVAGLLSSGVSAHLGAGGWIAEDTPSARVRSMLGQSRHGGMPPLLLLARITGSVDDAAARSAADPARRGPAAGTGCHRRRLVLDGPTRPGHQGPAVASARPAAPFQRRPYGPHRPVARGGRAHPAQRRGTCARPGHRAQQPTGDPGRRSGRRRARGNSTVSGTC